MGTEIHCRSYLSGFYSMRDLNEDLSSSSWPLFYADSNGQYCNGFASRASINGYPGDNKEALRQKMLEHEVVFKNQVSELHRVYRVQRDMMDEIKRRELDVCRASIEPASSSSLQASQAPSEGARTWHMAGFSLLNSSHSGTPTSEMELVKSPMNCTKMNTVQPGPFPFPFPTSKDNEVTDSRPPKVRKKLFDLHLPAEEYMDTEEEKNLTESKISGISSNACNGNLLVGSRDGAKGYCRVDTSVSASSLRGSIGLADLNHPPQIEEPSAPSPINFVGCTSKNEGTRDLNPSTTKPCVTGEVMHAHRGLLIDLESNGDEEVQRFLNPCEAGSGSARSNLTSINRSHQPYKSPFPSGPIQGSYHPPGKYPTDYRREDRWKEGQGLQHGSEFSGRSCDPQANNHWEPLTSRTPGSYPFFNASCVAYSWDHHISSWTNPSSSFAPNVTALGVSPNSAAMTRNFHLSDRLEPFGGKWQVNASSRLNPGLRIESKENGFHDASASGSKGLRGNLFSSSIDYWNHSRHDGQPSHCPNTHVVRDLPMNPSFKVLKPEIDINLNEVLSTSSSNEIEIKQDLSKIDGKSKLEDGPPALPWFKQRPEADENCKNAIVIDVNQPIMPNGDCDVTRKDSSENQVVKKLLGFPIYETGASDGLSYPPSTSASVDCHPEGKKGLIDINVVCEVDDERAAADATTANGACVRDYIDLNSCVSDSEDPPAGLVKVALEIDLEGPPVPENEDDNTLTEQNLPSEASEDRNEGISDEVLRDAADVMVAISSSHRDTGICDPPEPSLQESLLWFVDAVTSCANESGFKHCVLSTGEIDEFEVMTLQLAETKEENCIARPSALDIQQVDDAGGNILPSRPRRGQARRGRQRRDFQRDILPGLTSLSRHEVTEDIQAFTGLMRATGHSWSTGLTRRNGTRSGSARGRRRAAAAAEPTPAAAVPSPGCTPQMQQCTNSESRLQDRNLMGWWKTTRRPRRQRCPAGSTPAAD